MTVIQQTLAEKLTTELNATHVDIVDHSHLHLGHAQNTGHHLAITIVSPDFEGKNHLQRHRAVHQLIKEEMATFIHALDLKLYSPEEWGAQS